MRNGLQGRLVNAGVPYGLAALITEANYPGGDYAGLVDSAPKARARDLTRGFLEQAPYSLGRLAREIFGSSYDEAMAFSQEVEADAGLIGRLRRGSEGGVESARHKASDHLPGDSFVTQSDPHPGHIAGS